MLELSPIVARSSNQDGAGPPLLLDNPKGESYASAGFALGRYETV